ncbi:MAG TPA: carboxypeptidase-like regulatory domain-containing protein [Actinomycetota bacterium]|nr:carboxypeptidase-like regulatory domain-containing protein [Actinomycetota bacterium]
MRGIASLTLVVLLAACGGRGGGDAVDSGIRGRVLAGPQCPVVVEGSPCPDRPFVGLVRATSDGRTAEARTDQEGRFSLPVPPGRWTVSAVVEGGGPPTPIPVTVRVQPGAYVRVTLEVDTGIR